MFGNIADGSQTGDAASRKSEEISGIKLLLEGFEAGIQEVLLPVGSDNIGCLAFRIEECYVVHLSLIHI